MDKPFFLITIIRLLRIVCCERSVILWRISWDLKGMLCTGSARVPSCYWDKHRLLPGIEPSYPQLIASLLYKKGQYLQNQGTFFDNGSKNRGDPAACDPQFSRFFQLAIQTSAGSSGISCSSTSISRRSPIRLAPQEASKLSIFSMAPQKRSYSRLPMPTAP